MPLDPAIIGTSREERLADRLTDLERQVRQLLTTAGAQGAYDDELGTISTSSANYVDLGGPTVQVRVPDGGAFVQLFMELEGRDANNTGSPAQAAIYEATDFPLNLAGRIDFPLATFEKRRLVPTHTGATGNAGALGLGSFGTYWASAGLRTYQLQYRHVLGNLAEFKNRRLWARVLA